MEPALRLVFAGTPEPALPTLVALLDAGHEVAAVITRPDAPTGRGRRLTSSPVADLAAERGLPLLRPVTAREPEFAGALTALAPQIGVVVAYGQILRPAVLDIPALGWLNLHFSLLPAWRGAAPVAAAVRAGDDITGVTAFRLEAGLDTGPVYGTVTEGIRHDDTTGSLLERLSRSGAGLVVAVLAAMAANSLGAQPQAAEGVSLAPKITPADAEIDWAAPALAVDRQIRAMTPEPGAWTDSPWGRLIVGPVVSTELTDLRPGELHVAREVLVGTGTTAVRLREIQAPGKRRMPAPDWVRGARPPSGARLGRS